MEIHQKGNSTYDIYNTYIYKNVDWYPHFHGAFECVFVIKGSIEVQINQSTHVLNKDDFLLIPHFCIHHLKSITKDSLTGIVVFSKKYMSDYSNYFNNKTPTQYTFTLSPLDREFFLSKIIGQDRNKLNKIENNDEFSIKEGIFVILSEFIKQVQFTPLPYQADFICKIIDFIQANYEHPLPLSYVANKLGYDYKYLSKLLNNAFDFSFSDIVNQFRVEKASELIRNTEYPLSYIALKCGFPTIRSFNRIFKQITGITPSQFRKFSDNYFMR